MVGISSLTSLPDGRFVIPDRTANRIRVFGRNGSRVGAFGHFGEGPGELKGPLSVSVDSYGRFFVVQTGSPRLTVFSSNREKVQTYGIPGDAGFYVKNLSSGRLLVGTWNLGKMFALLTSDGKVVRRFNEVSPLVRTVPYWISLAKQNVAVFSDRIVCNISLFPTMTVYSLSGDSIGALGVAPDSWSTASHPHAGEFSGVVGWKRAEEWFKSFTVVQNIFALQDSLLVVQYAQFAPSDAAHLTNVRYTTVDVYTKYGRKIVADVPFSKRILGARNRLFVLESKPGDPPGGWRIGVYSWRWRGR